MMISMGVIYRRHCGIQYDMVGIGGCRGGQQRFFREMSCHGVGQLGQVVRRDGRLSQNRYGWYRKRRRGWCIDGKGGYRLLAAGTVQGGERVPATPEAHPSGAHGTYDGVRPVDGEQHHVHSPNNGKVSSSLLHGLGQVGLVPATLMPLVLRIAHVYSLVDASKGEREKTNDATVLGVLLWKEALETGLVPDNSTLRRMMMQHGTSGYGKIVEDCRWPEEPLRAVLLRELSSMGISSFAGKYPIIQESLLKSILQTTLEYIKNVHGIQEEEDREKDEHGNYYKTAEELVEEQLKVQGDAGDEQQKYRNPNIVPQHVLMQRLAEAEKDGKQNKEEEEDDKHAVRSFEEEQAEELVRNLVLAWEKPIQALSKAGKAFEGLEALLGSGEFSMNDSIWSRKGWEDMDELRKKLEDIKELRDLVRSLGRGGGWGPLRRAPVQYLDMTARMGLLRTTLEAQETRGLTRSDDISRLLPSEAANLARGRTVRISKLMFYSKLAEKSLQTYERDGWGAFPTQINIDRREVRPTADRGPILLCVDTSGSMRGIREILAKSLTLECMRAAKMQERGCYVYAFAGVRDVRELELNMDPQSVENLLGFLEKTFNGGSNFNAPIQMCLERLTQSKWANSDILLVSDGELRQPEHEIMRKLAGAKDKLGLRVHGLILGSPETQRADPAVLRSLCTHILPNGKIETLIHEFESWDSVKADTSLNFDWDDVEGNAARREAGLRLEALRQAEMKRRRTYTRKGSSSTTRDKLSKVLTRMPTKNTTTFEA